MAFNASRIRPIQQPAQSGSDLGLLLKILGGIAGAALSQNKQGAVKVPQTPKGKLVGKYLEVQGVQLEIPSLSTGASPSDTSVPTQAPSNQPVSLDMLFPEKDCIGFT